MRVPEVEDAHALEGRSGHLSPRCSARTASMPPFWRASAASSAVAVLLTYWWIMKW